MAEPLALLASSGSEQLDQITGGLLEVLELTFPQRVLGYYFEGSCADGAATRHERAAVSDPFEPQACGAAQRGRQP